jgi:crotonobetainyl-CoA:carnitine CoA-transferase CaiB-like acyl-CoA transferase
VTRQPLEGYKVVDMTEVWAGPMAASILGDLGAEVIRVESFPRAAATRPLAAGASGPGIVAGPPEAPRVWDRAPSYHISNRNKLAIALDAMAPKGRDILLRLIGRADVFLIGFTAGTAERMGLDYETLRQQKPDLVMLSLPGWGEKGPYKGYATYGSGLDAFAGHHHLRQYPGLDPTTAPSIFHSDATGALAIAFAAMGALHYRERSGRGQFIDLSQVEVLLNHLPGPLFDWQMNGRVQQPIGNRHPDMAPHGAYPCSEPATWLAIAVRDDAMWSALVGAIGGPAWALDPALRTLPHRLERRAEVDRHLSTWTRGLTQREAMERLQAAGVAAGAVYSPVEVMADAQLQARGFFPELPHPLLGAYRRPNVMWQMARTPSSIHRNSNTLGEHNREVLCGLLGLGDAEFADLEAAGIVGTEYRPGAEIDPT